MMSALTASPSVLWKTAKRPPSSCTQPPVLLPSPLLDSELTALAK